MVEEWRKGLRDEDGTMNLKLKTPAMLKEYAMERGSLAAARDLPSASKGKSKELHRA